MAQIKDVIYSLCKVLDCCNVIKISNETFRQGKFGKDEAVRLLLMLLAKFLVIATRLEINHESLRKIDSMLSEDLMKNVKLGMIQQGYHHASLLNLPKEGCHGSREVLLAIGWLMSKHRLIDLIMKIHISKNDTTAEMFPELLKKNKTPKSFELMNKPTSLGDTIQYVQWLSGQVQFSLRNLFAAEQSWCQLIHKIHKYTLGIEASPDFCHLSLMEAYLLKNPGELFNYIEKVEKDNICLEAYGKWKIGEEIFWKWMTKIIEIKDLSVVPNECHLDPLSSRGLLKQLQGKLLTELSQAVNDLQRIETFLEIGKRKEVFERRKSLTRPGHVEFPHHLSFSLSSTVNKSALVYTNHQLENLITQIECEIQENQNIYKEILQNIKLQGVICIPPKSKQKSLR